MQAYSVGGGVNLGYTLKMLANREVSYPAPVDFTLLHKETFEMPSKKTPGWKEKEQTLGKVERQRGACACANEQDKL